MTTTLELTDPSPHKINLCVCMCMYVNVIFSCFIAYLITSFKT